ncbi:MAG: ABC transporter permease [Lachnospiraceae bacterium]
MMNVKNRNYIRRLSFKFMRTSRKRNRIAVIAIVLTTLLFTSLFTIALSMNSTYQAYTFRQIGGYSHGTFKDVTQKQMQEIAAHSKVKAVGQRKVIGIAYDGVFAKVPAEISYMDENCTKWSYAKPTVGRIPKSGKEITMDTGALRLLGVEPELGAEISLTYTVGDKNQDAFEKTDVFTLVGYWEYDDISPVHYLNISEEYADTVESEGIAAGMNAFRVDLNVMMASSVDIRGQMEQVDRDLGYSWETYGEENSVRIGVNWGYTTAQLGERMDMQTVFAMLAFLALVIFTGYLIIYNIFQISVTGDIRFYGLLKTIGVTPRQLRRIIRQQALFLCIIGIPVGLLLGYGVGAILTPVVMAETTFGASATAISASPLIFIASALFALVTVLISCARPGRIAGKVSPVEATKYTEVIHYKKKSRSTRGAKVYQMAYANLGRNKLKTILVVVSLTLSVVLLNILVIFVRGFDMEKYLARQTCADFIVSSTDYFRCVSDKDQYISQDMMEEIEANTTQTTAGCGYTLSGEDPKGWMTEEEWRAIAGGFCSNEEMDTALAEKPRRGNRVAETTLMEGLDEALFEKLTVVEGDISPLFAEDSHAIALAVYTDDYGEIYNLEEYPALGETFSVTYVKNAYYIDSRTGEKCDEDTPEEFIEYYMEDGHDVDYTVCAYVIVPNSMSHRYSISGYDAILPVERLEKDSGQTVIPMFYLFDTPDHEAEQDAEQYLADQTEQDGSVMMYESKATLRAEFEEFQNLFLLLGGLLCVIIGIVGILNFFNAIMTGILSRRREFAVLQSIGMTGRQLRQMLVYEGIFYAGYSIVLSFIFVFALGRVIASVLENMFWFFTYRFTVTPILIVAPVFFLLGWLIPLAVYRTTARTTIVERLREVEAV